MGLIKEFREFAMRGNVVDMAIGVIVGSAFGKIVSSIVADIVMPPIGKLMGGVNFADLFLVLDSTKGSFSSLAKAREAGVPVIAYGQFINTIIDFVIVAACIFILIKVMNSLKRKQAAPTTPTPTTKSCTYCCSAISIRATRCPFCTSTLN